MDYPGYIKIYESGELDRRVEEGLRELSNCKVCPWDCKVNRLKNETKVCRTGRFARVASAFPHFGEENCLRGWNGSGTIFFAWCNLRCVFCQNYDISQEEAGVVSSPEQIGEMMLELQRLGCHNINFVTPEHVVPQVLEALPYAIRNGLTLPIVYNTSGFDSMKSLRLLEGIVDIYMPDFKYWDRGLAKTYVKQKNYPEIVRSVVKEMHRQVGDLTFDESGLARRGVLVRHLVMPGGIEDTRQIMRFLAEEISPDTYVNIMDQYRPAGEVNASKYAEINRTLTSQELEAAYEAAGEFGLHRFDSRSHVVRL